MKRVPPRCYGSAISVLAALRPLSLRGTLAGKREARRMTPANIPISGGSPCVKFFMF
jgi:hypothetical protein